MVEDRLCVDDVRDMRLLHHPTYPSSWEPRRVASAVALIAPVIVKFWKAVGHAVAFIIALWRRIIGTVMKHEEINEGGSFVVTGADSATFKLPGKKKPHDLHVHVGFDAACPPLVCNPHHHDKLIWEVRESPSHHRHSHPYELHIAWHVSGVRMIEWSVHYED